MNYIKLINNFWNMNDIMNFSTIETKLYFALLNYCNRLSWRQPLTIPNCKLKVLLSCSESSLVRGRNKLMKMNLIKYSRGRRNVAGRYYITDDSEFLRNTDEIEGIKSNPDYNHDCNHNSINDGSADGRGVGSYGGSSACTDDNIYKTKQTKRREEEVEEVKEEEEGFHHHHLLPHLKIIEMFNKICTDLPPFDPESMSLIKDLLNRRNAYLKDEKGWTRFFTKVNSSDFLNNRITDKKFLANLNWILEDNNFRKIMVGGYDKSFDDQNFHFNARFHRRMNSDD